MKQLVLNRNEIVMGPSPAALRAIKKFKPEHVSRYLDDYYNSILIPELSKMFNVPGNRIILGYGSENILGMMFDMVPTSCILANQYHYIFYDKYLNYKKIPLKDFRVFERENDFKFDIDDCLKKYQELKPKILLLTSPNNPTGNTMTLSEVTRILDTVDKDCLVVIDQAYWGFDADYDEAGFMALLNKYGNLMFFRTFSKMFALAGLRIGYALCGDRAVQLIGCQQLYLGFSRILEEVAVAALRSKSYYKNLAKKMVKDRTDFIKGVNQLKNFKAFDSRATFVLVKLTPAAVPVFKTTLAKSKFDLSKFVFDNFIRVSLEPKKYSKEFLKILQKIDKQIA